MHFMPQSIVSQAFIKADITSYSDQLLCLKRKRPHLRVSIRPVYLMQRFQETISFLGRHRNHYHCLGSRPDLLVLLHALVPRPAARLVRQRVQLNLRSLERLQHLIVPVSIVNDEKNPHDTPEVYATATGAVKQRQRAPMGLPLEGAT